MPYAIFAALGIILSAVYMLYLCQRVLFGPLREPPHTPDLSAGLRRDLNGREIGILAPIAVACLVLGVLPNLLIKSIQPAAEQQVLARIFDHTEMSGLVAAAPRDGREAAQPQTYMVCLPSADSAATGGGRYRMQARQGCAS